MIDKPGMRPTDFVLRHATLIIFVAVFLFFGAQSLNFFGSENVGNIVKQASFTGVIAVGMTFVMLTAGIDLSVGSNMYLSAMAAGYFLQIPAMQNGVGAIVAVIIGLAAGALFGAINAFCIVVLRITPFMVTLATLVAGRGLGTAITESFGIEFPRAFTDLCTWSLVRPPETAGGSFTGAVAAFVAPLTSAPIFVFLLVIVTAHIVLTRTAFGRQVYAIGNDLEAARKAGIDTRRIVFSVYVISGLCAALGGLMLIALIGRLNQTFGVGKEFEVITAAVLGGASLFGGVGNAFGAVVGSVLVQMVQAGMVFIQVNLYLQPMVLAAIIFLAVFFDSLRERRLLKLKRRSIRVDDMSTGKATRGARQSASSQEE
jgi:ribose/xylose/arabinose/galactoside ABC-type transport system permease subunit